MSASVSVECVPATLFDPSGPRRASEPLLDPSGPRRASEPLFDPSGPRRASEPLLDPDRPACSPEAPCDPGRTGRSPDPPYAPCRTERQAASEHGLDTSGGEPRLEDLLTGLWEGLAAHRVVECPACGAEMRPEYGAHALPIGGRCRGCGSTLA